MNASSRCPLRSGICLPVIAVVLCMEGATVAQELVRSEDAVVALYSLQAQLDVDTMVMRRLEQRLEESLRSRSCLLYTSPSPRDGLLSRMPSSA